MNENISKKGYKQTDNHKRKIGLANSISHNTADYLKNHPGYWLGKNDQILV